MTEIIVDLRSIEMSSEEKKGRLSEDDVGTAEETTNFEDRINATLDKILDDEDDELDDIVVDYEDSGEAEEDVDNGMVLPNRIPKKKYMRSLRKKRKSR